MSATVVMPRYSAPARVAVGSDGIPHYISSHPGTPGFWRPPSGQKLEIFHNGVQVFWIVEADRKAGWAKGYDWEIVDGAMRKRTHDENGVSISRMYEGRITFRLVRR